MARGVDAFNILALTFTNKAAAEMKERIGHILGTNEARNLYIGTFHSVFARILRTEANKLGYPNNFTIYDTDDAKSVIKTVINEMNLDDKHYKPATVYNRISSAKNALVSAEDYKNDWHIQQEDMRANRPMLGHIYDAYVKRWHEARSLWATQVQQDQKAVVFLGDSVTVGTPPSLPEDGYRAQLADTRAALAGTLFVAVVGYNVGGLVGVHRLVKVEFTGQQVGVVAGGHRRSDR